MLGGFWKRTLNKQYKYIAVTPLTQVEQQNFRRFSETVEMFGVAFINALIVSKLTSSILDCIKVLIFKVKVFE